MTERTERYPGPYPLRKRGREVTFGHFRVMPWDDGRMPVPVCGLLVGWNGLDLGFARVGTPAASCWRGTGP